MAFRLRENAATLQERNEMKEVWGVLSCALLLRVFFFCVRFSVCARSLLIGKRRDPGRFRALARTTVVKNVLSSFSFLVFPFPFVGSLWKLLGESELKR